MMRASTRLMILGLTSALALSACNGTNAKPQSASAKTPPKPFDRDPFPSTYHAYPGVPTLVTNVTVLDGEGNKITNGQVLFADGKIVAVGQTVSAPAGVRTIDGNASGGGTTGEIACNSSSLQPCGAP